LVDALLRDLSIPSGMFVARRASEEDSRTFVIQTGEDGRRRLPWPDLSSDESIESVAAEAQAHLGQVLGRPVPECPLHEHALSVRVSGGALTWICPDGQWTAPLGEYEELRWPHFDVRSLASVLSRRLERRGITGVVTAGVRPGVDGAVAEFGVEAVTDELREAIQKAAAPLPVSLREFRGPRPRRVHPRPLAR
jgi:hypothetical protein